jgi:hypothetical protein
MHQVGMKSFSNEVEGTPIQHVPISCIVAKYNTVQVDALSFAINSLLLMGTIFLSQPLLQVLL